MRRFSHPAHGFHAAEGAEAEAMIKAGWIECGWKVAKGPLEPPAAADPAESEPDPQPEPEKRPVLTLSKNRR